MPNALILDILTVNSNVFNELERVIEGTSG